MVARTTSTSRLIPAGLRAWGLALDPFTEPSWVNGAASIASASQQSRLSPLSSTCLSPRVRKATGPMHLRSDCGMGQSQRRFTNRMFIETLLRPIPDANSFRLLGLWEPRVQGDL